MAKAAAAGTEICRDLAITPEEVAIGDEAFKAHRPPRRKRLGADAHLSTEAISESIRKAG